MKNQQFQDERANKTRGLSAIEVMARLDAEGEILPGGAALTLREFGVAFSEQIVLSSVSLSMPKHGVYTLLGPGGSGKSTLLRTLGGLNDPKPGLSTWGTVEIDGELLGANNRPTLVSQNAQLLHSTVRENLVSVLWDRNQRRKPEQTRWAIELLCANGLSELVDSLEKDVLSLSQGLRRRLAITRAIAIGSSVMMIDEPTAGLNAEQALPVLKLIANVANNTPILLVTHNRQHARFLGGRTALLAGGTIQEHQLTEKFFERPQTSAVRSFLLHGNCAVASPMAKADELAEGTKPPVAPGGGPTLDFSGPRNFYWIEKNVVGGLPRPGIVESVEHDLRRLAELGVTLLITLEEKTLVVPAHIAHLHFPIPDMKAPDVAATTTLLAKLEREIDAGAVVAFHCLAGLGRTGTLLASWLIFSGSTAIEAIGSVRAIKPRSIQSEAQVEFLMRFESTTKGKRKFNHVS